ncbi:DUF1697 domain-containing protein [Lacisediminihabitans changchengi]|uniref:DUF1697 domain-containing protein n=1 Tax=Lacisediminihabitans changchengi TaxID=2787634 RepID=A0A934SNG3_9MICO|nr:DUF1697 domain-containing protein [Lacisediminihabitans changchengi]MBK4346085.1 DUF1697 domain-containing protein [Lacisediminihabitans changchengi]
MTDSRVALLRGINVGTAKAVAMADLRRVFAGLGATDVVTLLRSGNVVFSGAALTAPSIEEAVLAATGVQSSVVVLTAREFRAIADENPLSAISTGELNSADGSKSFVTITSEPFGSVELPDAATLAPERLELGRSRAIYQWMPDGSLQTRVPKSFWKQFPGHLTARNENTVGRIVAELATRSD